MQNPSDAVRIKELSALLGAVTHFRALPEADLQAIIAAGAVQHYPQNAVIFHEGAPCAGMFVLLEGQVHLRKFGPEGQEQIMAIIDPVIMFNEVPVLDGGPNVATATASQPCTTWSITCDAFQALLARYPMIGLGLLRVLARRNRYLIAQYEDLSFRSVVARTAKLLLDLSAQGASAINRRAHPNVELAARIATGPEPFSRSLRLLQQQGHIACTRAQIVVLHGEALAELAYLPLT